MTVQDSANALAVTTDLPITPTPAGNLTSRQNTVIVSANTPGYSLSVAASGSNPNYNSGNPTNAMLYLNPTAINPTPAIISTSNPPASAAVLATNSWGFAVPKNQAAYTANVSGLGSITSTDVGLTSQIASAPFDNTYTEENSSTASVAKYASMPNPDDPTPANRSLTIKQTTAPSNADGTTLFFGSKVDTTVPAGTYRTTVTWTAVGEPVPPVVEPINYVYVAETGDSAANGADGSEDNPFDNFEDATTKISAAYDSGNNPDWPVGEPAHLVLSGTITAGVSMSGLGYIDCATECIMEPNPNESGVTKVVVNEDDTTGIVIFTLSSTNITVRPGILFEYNSTRSTGSSFPFILTGETLLEGASFKCVVEKYVLSGGFGCHIIASLNPYYYNGGTISSSVVSGMNNAIAIQNGGRLYLNPDAGTVPIEVIGDIYFYQTSDWIRVTGSLDNIIGTLSVRYSSANNPPTGTVVAEKTSGTFTLGDLAKFTISGKTLALSPDNTQIIVQ
ncbi:MAG: hypothetical protein LBC95_01035 [Candidatus Nomurabacteria bacterium]|jgi:hypothetical protein|nr:hypothetical protein [Candidatus Nomurabacteria bacterium]